MEIFGRGMKSSEFLTEIKVNYHCVWRPKPERPLISCNEFPVFHYFQGMFLEFFRSPNRSSILLRQFIIRFYKLPSSHMDKEG